MGVYMLLKIGDQAPQFNLQNQDGDNISLDSLKGTSSLLNNNSSIWLN